MSNNNVDWTEGYHFTWFDHLNADWSCENIQLLLSRHGTNELFEKLLTNREAQLAHHDHQNIAYSALPTYESKSIDRSVLHNYLTTLIVNQQQLVKAVNIQLPFTTYLRKRLVILQRLYHAILFRHYGQEKPILHHLTSSAKPSHDSAVVPDSPRSHDSAIMSTATTNVASGEQSQGVNLLLEVGVKTAINVVFMLLKQSWTSGADNSAYWNQLLTTALQTLMVMPPLSLASETKLPKLAQETLDTVVDFLTSSVDANSGNTFEGRQTALELLLAIAIQKGSLGAILNWIQLTLSLSASMHQLLQPAPMTIHGDIFNRLLLQIEASNVR